MGVSRDRRVPSVKHAGGRYFDVPAMLAWFHRRYPDREQIGSRTIARDLGLPRSTVQSIIQGRQPNVHTYCRMLAYARLPIGTWLDL